MRPGENPECGVGVKTRKLETERRPVAPKNSHHVIRKGIGSRHLREAVGLGGSTPDWKVVGEIEVCAMPKVIRRPDAVQDVKVSARIARIHIAHTKQHIVQPTTAERRDQVCCSELRDTDKWKVANSRQKIVAGAIVFGRIHDIANREILGRRKVVINL